MKLCPFLKEECIQDKCQLWGIVEFKSLYPEWVNVAEKVINGEPINEPVYGCGLTKGVATCIPSNLSNYSYLMDCR